MREYFCFIEKGGRVRRRRRREKLLRSAAASLEGGGKSLQKTLSLSLYRTVAIPTASATTFFSVPAISTPTRSEHARTTKLSVENSRTNSSAVAGLAAATVASVSPPRATSSAMLAPISTAVSIPSTRSTIAEISCGPSGLTRIPLISESATVLREPPPGPFSASTAPTRPRTTRPAC